MDDLEFGEKLKLFVCYGFDPFCLEFFFVLICQYLQLILRLSYQ